jgi:hypothetical protein
MLTEQEKRREIQQWGQILQLAQDRKRLAEMAYSNEGRMIEKLLEKLESKIREVRR